MDKIQKYSACLAVVVGAVLYAFVPTLALANSTLPTAQWNFYEYADQTTPSTTAQLNIQVKNTTTANIDSISASVPNLNACILVTAVLAQYASDNGDMPSTVPQTIPTATCSSGVSGFQIGSSGSASINLKPGATLNIYLTLDVGCITSSYPTCDPDPTHTTQGDWQNVHYFHYTGGGGVATYNAEGNTTFKVTNTPNPMQQPLDWGRDNAYANGLNNSGISSPTAISGLFPPGPLDSLLILPVTLTTQILSAAGGMVVRPTTSVFGTTMTFPTSTAIYGVIGSTATALISAALSFMLLYPWLKSLYHRLQRATSLKSHADDTWGVL